MQFLLFLLRSSFRKRFMNHSSWLELKAQCWMTRWSLLCPTSERVSAYPSQQQRRSVSRYSKGTEAVQMQSRSCTFTFSTFIQNSKNKLKVLKQVQRKYSGNETISLLWKGTWRRTLMKRWLLRRYSYEKNHIQFDLTSSLNRGETRR